MVAEKWVMIRQLGQEYPVDARCQWLGLARSSYDYHARGPDETTLLRVMEQILMRWPFYAGALRARRLQAQLRCEGWTAGERHPGGTRRRLLKQLGMTRAVGRIRIQTTDSNHAHWRSPNLIRQLTATHPDQIWHPEGYPTRPPTPSKPSPSLSPKNTGVR